MRTLLTMIKHSDSGLKCVYTDGRSARVYKYPPPTHAILAALVKNQTHTGLRNCACECIRVCMYEHMWKAIVVYLVQTLI